jgi:hypothetical protein
MVVLQNIVEPDREQGKKWDQCPKGQQRARGGQCDDQWTDNGEYEKAFADHGLLLQGIVNYRNG